MDGEGNQQIFPQTIHLNFFTDEAQIKLEASPINCVVTMESSYIEIKIKQELKSK